MSWLWLMIALTDLFFRVPNVGRPRDSFFGAIGHPITIQLEVEPRTVRFHESLKLSIRIDGAWNPSQIVRPDLRQLEDFSRDFWIDDLETPMDPLSPRLFRYLLRPRHPSVRAVPPLLMRYWDPVLRYFATTATETVIPIVVIPDPPASLASLWGDDFAFLTELPPLEELTQSPGQGRWEIVWFFAVLLAPPSLVFLGTRVRNHRERKGRPSIEAFIQQAEAELVAAITSNPTPKEQARIVHFVLYRLEATDGPRKPWCSDLRRRCDRLRYGPDGTGDDRLLQDALTAVRSRPRETR